MEVARALRQPIRRLRGTVVPAIGLAALLSLGGACSDQSELALGVNTDIDVPVGASPSFGEADVLALGPGEEVEVVVSTDPPKPYTVNFYLVGDTLDASLDTASVQANGQGEATVRLRAPNGATNFVLRAAIDGGNSADLPIAVSEQGFGSLDVKPVYKGSRETRNWVVHVVSGTTCDDLAPSFPEDPVGSLTAVADKGDPLTVDSAPVGPNLAVFVRAGHYMWGCSDESDLLAGATKEVAVTIANAPITTDDAELDVTLAFAPEAEPYGKMLSDARAALLEGWLGGADHDREALLTTMQTLASDPAAFDEASTSGNWADAMGTHFIDHDVALSDTINGFLDSGLAAQPDVLTGHIDAAAAGAPGTTLFRLKTIGLVDAAAAGVDFDYLMNLSVDVDDTARLGGTLFWLGPRYVGAAAAHEALQQNPGASDFPALLAEEAACSSITLSGFAGCDQACMADLCTQAVATRWQAALDSLPPGGVGEIPFEASGLAEFSDDAALVGFQGFWIGNVEAGGLTAKVTGTAQAEEPAPTVD